MQALRAWFSGFYFFKLVLIFFFLKQVQISFPLKKRQIFANCPNNKPNQHLFPYLDIPNPLSLSILWGRELFNQHRGENPNPAVEFSLPKAIIILVFLVQDADDGSLWEGQLVIRLPLIVIKCFYKTDCKMEKGKPNELRKKNILSIHQVFLAGAGDFEVLLKILLLLSQIILVCLNFNLSCTN